MEKYLALVELGVVMVSLLAYTLAFVALVVPTKKFLARFACLIAAGNCVLIAWDVWAHVGMDPDKIRAYGAIMVLSLAMTLIGPLAGAFKRTPDKKTES